MKQFRRDHLPFIVVLALIITGMIIYNFLFY